MNRFAVQVAAVLTAALAATAWTSTARADDDTEDQAEITTSSSDDFDTVQDVYDDDALPPASGVSQRRVITAPTYAPQRDVVTEQYLAPNAPLITSGAIMFGASYGASVVVATQSNTMGDDRLYVPVAGPWMDLANRRSCTSSFAPGCDNETTNKVLLVADGIFQGLGALQMLGGFLFPTTHTVVVEKPIAKGVHVTPTGGAGGAGITAYGVF